MANTTLRGIPRDAKLVVGLVAGAEFVNHMYLVLLPPILGLLVTDLKTSLAILGLAMGVQRLSTTVFQLPFGYVADTYGRVRSLGLSIGIGTLGVFIIALANSTVGLFIGVSIVGLGVAGHHPSHYPLLSQAVPESVRARAFSIRGFAGALGFATPPALITAVLALPWTSWRHSIALIGVLGIAYGTGAFFLLRRLLATDAKTENQSAREPPSNPTNSILTRVRAELSAAVGSPPVLGVAFLSLVWAIASNGITSYIVVLLTDGYAVSLGTANLVLSGMFVAGAGMSLVGGWLTDRFSAGSVLTVTITVVGVLLALLTSLLLPSVIVIPLAVTLGGFRMAGGPSRSKLIDRFSDESSLGRNFAVMTVGLMLGGAIGPSIFGALINIAGLQVAFYTMVVVIFSALVVAVALVVIYDDYAAATVDKLTA